MMGRYFIQLVRRDRPPPFCACSIHICIIIITQTRACIIRYIAHDHRHHRSYHQHYIAINATYMKKDTWRIPLRVWTIIIHMAHCAQIWHINYIIVWSVVQTSEYILSGRILKMQKPKSVIVNRYAQWFLSVLLWHNNNLTTKPIYRYIVIFEYLPWSFVCVYICRR